PAAHARARGRERRRAHRRRAVRQCPDGLSATLAPARRGRYRSRRVSVLTEGGKPLRVLLADDHEVVRQALKALLERHGFAVVAEVADGRAALEAASPPRPDVAVL